MGQDHIEIALREVRARVADLVLAPPVLECPLHLAGRAHVHADALAGPGPTQPADEPQHLGFVLRLERQAHAAVEPGAVERRPERERLFPDTDQVVRVHGRAVLTRDRFGISAGDVQTTAPDVESGAGPPRMRAHLRLRHGGSGYPSDA